MADLLILPSLDDEKRAEARKRELDISRERSLALARETIAIVETGAYRCPSGREVSIAEAIARARGSRWSILPDTPLPEAPHVAHDAMRIQVCNETTSSAARRLLARYRTVALTLLEEPYLLSVLTCAAPVVGDLGRDRAAALLRSRIGRVLEVMAACRFEAIVLGAWGCGAFGNDPRTTAVDFRTALSGRYRGAFREVVFAVTDWSPERRFLGPFARVFAEAAGP